MSSQTLYRFWNADGELLYVGISVRPWDRWKQHRGDKPWWEEVTSVTLENFATRAEVLAAELQAIRTEAPKYNIAGIGPMVVVSESDATPADWGGIHSPLIAGIADWVYCSCAPPDWDACPGLPHRGDDLDAYYKADADWRDQQTFYQPEEYSAHVIAEVLGSHFTVSEASA